MRLHPEVSADPLSKHDQAELIARCEHGARNSNWATQLFRLSKYLPEHGTDLTAVYDRKTGHYIGSLKPVGSVNTVLYWEYSHPGMDANHPPTAKLRRLALKCLLASWASAMSRDLERYE